MSRLVILSFSVILIFGCAATRPLPPEKTYTEHVFNKNYRLGAQQESAVGDSIVRLKNYFLLVREINALEPTSEFSITIGGRSFVFKPKQKFNVMAMVEVEGRDQRLIPVVTDTALMLGSYGIAVREDGSISKKGFILGGTGWQHGLHDVIASPNTAKMVNSLSKEVDAMATFENHELIYNGTDGKSIFITYREFTPDNLARPAFFQNLTYEAKSEFIRFKKYRIRVIKANTESLSYEVVEDGIRP